MRHSVYGKKLSRTKNQRTALFKGLVSSLILHESIQTTQAKAQAIKGLVDRLITQAKSTNTRRLVSQFLTDKRITEKLINDLLPRLSDRNSGYTSVVKLGFRQGDGSMMVQMTLLATEATKVKKEVEVKKEAKVEEVETKTVEASAKTKVSKPKVKKVVKKGAKA